MPALNVIDSWICEKIFEPEHIQFIKGEIYFNVAFSQAISFRCLPLSWIWTNFLTFHGNIELFFSEIFAHIYENFNKWCVPSRYHITAMVIERLHTHKIYGAGRFARWSSPSPPFNFLESPSITIIVSISSFYKAFPKQGDLNRSKTELSLVLIARPGREMKMVIEALCSFGSHRFRNQCEIWKTWSKWYVVTFLFLFRKNNLTCQLPFLFLKRV